MASIIRAVLASVLLAAVALGQIPGPGVVPGTGTWTWQPMEADGTLGVDGTVDMNSSAMYHMGGTSGGWSASQRNGWFVVDPAVPGQSVLVYVFSGPLECGCYEWKVYSAQVLLNGQLSTKPEDWTLKGEGVISRGP